MTNRIEILKIEVARFQRLAAAFRHQAEGDKASADRLEARKSYDPEGDKACAKRYRLNAVDAMSTAVVYQNLAADIEEQIKALPAPFALKVVKA